MLPLLDIHWNPDPEMFKLFGSISVLYYSLLWLVGLVAAYFIVKKEYADRRISAEKFDPLCFYCFFGILIGMRLGHCLFYQPDYYLSGLKPFLEMLLPIHFLPDGDWKFIGYKGFASHGGTLGLIIALWLYCRKTKMHYMDVLDMIAVATPITACCIRLANLMNSEIIGSPTNVPWAFVFERVDMVPRHPAQLYEAIAYFVFFLIMVWLYRRKKQPMEQKPRTDFSKGSKTVAQPLSSGYHRGFYFGLCLTEIFAFRFFVEFLKENQVDFEEGMTLNMGQWLSIPFVLIGLYFMFFYDRKKA